MGPWGDVVDEAFSFYHYDHKGEILWNVLAAKLIKHFHFYIVAAVAFLHNTQFCVAKGT